MLDSERIFEEILDLAQNLSVEELESIINNLEILIENKEESEED